ncbi:hypothetical protein BJ322DRAFT_247219 [Thelephora terrestris]|uniref:Uncharacterized protein n=1 Tax=Thelephora terrestris TaxID=56493 RepID=A0A9P6HAR2_9AGAM|nr:hypothetical protein BJ322DRAFT_247219 [Thelephora terrestris]
MIRLKSRSRSIRMDRVICRVWVPKKPVGFTCLTELPSLCCSTLRVGRQRPQSYDKPIGFVEDGEGSARDKSLAGKTNQTDDGLEAEMKEARLRYEEASFRDREYRYEPRECVRIQTLERTLAMERVVKEAENRDRIEMRSSLDIWDDDESD